MYLGNVHVMCIFEPHTRATRPTSSHIADPSVARNAPHALPCVLASSLPSSQFHLSLSFKIERYIPAIKEIEPRSLCPFVPQIHALSTWCIEAGSRCYFYFCWVPLLWTLLLLVSFSHEYRYFSPSWIHRAISRSFANKLSICAYPTCIISSRTFSSWHCTCSDARPFIGTSCSFCSSRRWTA